MNPKNPEKFSLYSIIWLRDLQWRRHELLRERTPRPLKCYQASPQWVLEGKAPRTVAKFHFLERCKVLENQSNFQKYQHFLAQKNYFSYEKFRKIKHIRQEFLNFFEYLLENFQFS